MCMQGVVLGLRALVAAGAVKLCTLQEVKADATFIVERDSEGNLADPAAFEEYLNLVRSEGEAHHARDKGVYGFVVTNIVTVAGLVWGLSVGGRVFGLVMPWVPGLRGC